jgi:hypothetical protein
MRRVLILSAALLLSVLCSAQTKVTGTGLPKGTSVSGSTIKFPGAVYTNSEYNNGVCATAATINPVNGNRQKITLTAGQTCALTFTQPVNNTVSIRLKVIQSSSGSFNGTISGGKWPGGTVPTITATSGAVDLVVCDLDGTDANCVASQDIR